jgi:hypothetical protein
MTPYVSKQLSADISPVQPDELPVPNALTTPQPSPPRTRWARPTGLTGFPLRRGAWYPVFGASTEEIGILARGRVIIVPRSAVELQEALPLRWSIVDVHTGASYLVCPQCADRFPVQIAAGSWTTSFICRRCDRVFAVDLPVVAQDNHGAIEPARTELRRAERRWRREPQRVDRRSGSERRGLPGARAPLFDDFTTP